MTNQIPAWAVDGVIDIRRGVKCRECGKFQDPAFKACIFCCKHDELGFHEKWSPGYDSGEWVLSCECNVCGKNFDFSNELLKVNYVAVRRRKVD